MPFFRDPRLDKFCTMVAEGMGVESAARLAGYSDKYAETHLILRGKGVRERIAELKEIRDKIVSAENIAREEIIKAHVTTEDARGYLKTITLGLISDARRKGKYGDALEAVEMLAKLSGVSITAVRSAATATQGDKNVSTHIGRVASEDAKVDRTPERLGHLFGAELSEREIATVNRTPEDRISLGDDRLEEAIRLLTDD